MNASNRTPFFRRWAFFPFWAFSFVLSLAGVWIPLFLRGTQDPVTVDPIRNGALYVFALTLVFASYGSFLDETREIGVAPSGAWMVALGTAVIIGMLAGVKYTALLIELSKPEPRILAADAQLGMIFAAAASAYGLVCAYWRNGLRIVRGGHT